MKYSIITINYNNQIGLRRTIESVVGQTYTDYEYIVIDGGSTDGSVEVIKEFSDRITYWVSERDCGIYNAMNKGVAQAHGEYCIFMNSGDSFYKPITLELVFSKGYKELIYVGKVIGLDNGKVLSNPILEELTFYSLYSGAIPHQGSFINTELLKKYPYDESLKIVSDWKFFIQTTILDNCSFRYIEDIIAYYDTTGLSSRNTEIMRKEKQMILESLFPSRILDDYYRMKQSECLTQSITSQLRIHYNIDKLLYRIGSFLLRLIY